MHPGSHQCPPLPKGKNQHIMSKHVCSVCSGQLHLFLLPVILKYRLVLLDELLAFCLSCYSSWNTPFLLSAPQKSSMSLRTQHGINHSPYSVLSDPSQVPRTGILALGFHVVYTGLPHNTAEHTVNLSLGL